MTPTTFEDRLLTELRAVVAARPTPAPETAPAPVVTWRSPRAARLLAGGAVAAAAVTTVLLVSGGDPASPAFAVERQSDGTVSVEIDSLRDAGGLEQKLRAVGINAVVDFTPAGKTCAQPRGEHASPSTPRGPSTLGMAAGRNGPTTFTIGRDEVRAGETLVIAGSISDGAVTLGTEVVEGAVAPCRLVDAPAPPAPTNGDPSSGATRSLSGSAGDSGPSTHVGP